MALNIKNERTVALARELAELNGTSITSAIEDALEARLAQARTGETPVDRDRAARMARAREILAEIHENITDEQRELFRTADDYLYDENGLLR